MPEVTDSILNDIKKLLGFDPDYKVFDTDIILHINSVFSTLRQLGIGPVDSFEITDESETWADFFAESKNFNDVRTYVWLRVKLLFDPPPTSFAIESFKKQAEEIEWRLNVTREGVEHPWTDPEIPI